MSFKWQELIEHVRPVYVAYSTPAIPEFSICLNFIIYFTIVFFKSQDALTRLKIVIIFVLIILVFKALMSIFQFCLENRFFIIGLGLVVCYGARSREYDSYVDVENLLVDVILIDYIEPVD